MKKNQAKPKNTGTTMSVAKAKQISKTTAGGVKANLKKPFMGGGRSK
jgi:hypothetical protein